ncbi:hypothetical protein BGW80DRAFT_339666 [Lactifluus volemus]|nr:hypothetical protein BGW80DRAFT_339666 [Lactifluus volemus]
MQASATVPFQEQAVPQHIPPTFPSGGMAGGPTQQQMSALSQHAQSMANNQMNTLQRAVQAQDHPNTRPLNNLLTQSQQPPNGSASFTARAGQNFHLPGSGLSQGQGQGSLQNLVVQPNPSAPSAGLQSSAPPSQAPSQGGQQMLSLNNIADAPLPHLINIFNQLARSVTEGEKTLQALGEPDPQRRAKLDNQKQIMLRIREIITVRRGRLNGDPQQAVNGASWLGAGQRPTGQYPTPERPPQHNSPSLHQASVNQVAPQRSIPTPQQNFAPSTTPQPNMTQMSPHVSTNGLPFNGGLATMAGTPPQRSPQIAQTPSQQPIQTNMIPVLPEDKFKAFFANFARTAGIRATERDFTIEGRPINPWLLHRAVFSRGGFDSVSTNDEWPIIGAAVGFPTIGPGDQPPRCVPLTAQRLQQLYRDSLRPFDQTYMHTVARLRNSQLSSVPSQPPQPQAQPRQPTEADYQALLSTTSESSLITPHAMSILSRFAHTSGADLEAHRIPRHIIAFAEQNRDHLQRTARNQNGFRATLTSTKAPQLDNRVQFNQGSALQAMDRLLSLWQVSFSNCSGRA